MSVVILDDYCQDSQELEIGETYSLSQVMPTFVVDGVLVNYVVVNRSNGAYEYVAASLPEAKAVFHHFETESAPTFSGDMTSEPCH